MGSVTKSGNIRIQNKTTLEVISITSEDLFFEVVDSSERSMGPEYTHEARFGSSFESGGDYELIISVWEYPVGGYNSEDIVLETDSEDIEILENNLVLGITLSENDV